MEEKMRLLQRLIKLIVFWTLIFFVGFTIIACGGGGTEFDNSSGEGRSVATVNPPTDTFTVELPCTEKGWFGEDCVNETIEIPNGRPIYALLVSGFHQNKNLDMFHYYNFAKCLLEKGAYVHYAWWNNLLAPYMEEPLHNNGSVPSTEIVPYHDMWGQYNWFTWWPKPYPDKAIPAEDFQFQKDATALLKAIRQHNPDAAIILVGHSMGGDAVVRLADKMPGDFDIDLLAPIDPVGNRTCMPSYSPGTFLNPNHCSGDNHFKRFYAVRNDWWFFPSKRQFGTNIKYLYHRWQEEYQPPFDWLSKELFAFTHPRPHSQSIGEGTTNVQAKVETSLFFW